MPAIKFVHADSDGFVPASEGAKSGRQAASKITAEELAGISVRRYFGSEEGELEMFVVRLTPDHPLAPHAHRADEVMYVLEGDLVVGNRSYPAGSAVLIPGNTLYGLRSGPSGLAFINFRAQSDPTYMTKDEFLADRRPREDDQS